MALFKKLFGKTLFYPGCMLNHAMPEAIENYKKIFNKLGIDFIVFPLDKEICCGSPVLNAGYKKDARKLAKKNLELFKKENIVKVITPCPGCYNMFKNEYPEFSREWREDKDAPEISYALIEILNKLKEKKVKINLGKQVVSYHDPCHLGRFSDIYDEPREIIKLLGGELKEMKHNRENAICCGAGGGLRANSPKTAKKIAKMRCSEVSLDAEKILTPCGLCTMNLQTADNRAIEFSEWVVERLGVRG
jgi:heterodisulfide reductase subunit D